MNSFVHLNECSGTLSCGPRGTCHRLRRNSKIASGYLAAINSITSPRLPQRRHRRQGSRFGCAGARWSPTCAWEQADDQLVGGFNPLKNISQLGLLFPIYGKIYQMFQTTNQSGMFPWIVPLSCRPASHRCKSRSPRWSLERLIPPNPWTTEKRDWCNNNGMLILGKHNRVSIMIQYNKPIMAY